MPRHCTQCRRKDETVTADALRKLGAENRDSFNAACANMRGSLLFGMRELESKKNYTPYEVAELWRFFGHCAVPVQFERVYKRVPVYNTLTDRRFDTQIRPPPPPPPNEVQFSNLPDSRADFDLAFSRVLRSLEWQSILDDAKAWVNEIGPELLSTYTSIIKIAYALQETLCTMGPA